ncbi:DUF6176 family protein [Silvibacterium sp.]|uniref:DUF6176 family protein n=1 Tax=Silvibacterium sp. TaxID=1964179 RepID=UPI0039E45D3C
MFLFVGGLLLGSLITLGVMQARQYCGADASSSVATKTESPFTVTLYRFELNQDKLDRFEDWVQFEHAHHAETVTTLEREKMYFEAIFRDREHQPNVIYWLAVQGQGGGHANDSPLPIDKQYEQFMQETLKKGSRTTLSTEYSLVPPFVVQTIQHH